MNKIVDTDKAGSIPKCKESQLQPVNDEITYYNFCPIFLINMTG